MRDDFAALDLFTAGGKFPGKRRRALFALPRRRVQSQAKRPLTAFLPLIAAKMKKKPKAGSNLQGWPVALSWPAKDLGDSREDFSALM